MYRIKMCESVAGQIFMHVSDCCKIQKMSDKAVEKDLKTLKLVPTLRLKKCVEKLLKNCFLQ